MKANEAFRSMMARKGVTLTELAGRMQKSVRLVSDRLRRDNPTVDTINEVSRVLDYKLVLVPIGSKLPKDSY